MGDTSGERKKCSCHLNVLLIEICDDTDGNSPGRHFAVNEMKVLICNVLMNYDLKFADPKLKPGVVPDAMWVGTMCALDSNVELMFKRRKMHDRDCT